MILDDIGTHAVKIGMLHNSGVIKNEADWAALSFVRTSKGFKVTNPEGYVAIDRVSGNAVKLVDRMEFSYNNFTAIKAWDR